MTKQGVVLMCLADRTYPQKLAFVFLQEVAELFEVELQNTYGTTSGVDYRTKIESIETQYAFIKFGKSPSLYFQFADSSNRKTNQQKTQGLQRCQCQRKYRQVE